jgi:CAAX protease family protein
MALDHTEASVASWWHTVIVLAGLAGLSLATGYQHGLPNAHIPGLPVRPSSYLTILAAEWLLVWLIWLPLRSRGLSLASLVSGRWDRPRSFFRDLGIAVGFVIVIVALEQLLGFLFHASPDSALAAILPKTPFELVLYLLVAGTAGFCEELIFRGYLDRQFSAWTGNRAFGIILQGLAFGAGHAYYGPKFMFIIAVHGCLLGVLAYWRKSLRPGILAHALQDSLGGLVWFFVPK